jgi:hypothetical protein
MNTYERRASRAGGNTIRNCIITTMYGTTAIAQSGDRYYYNAASGCSRGEVPCDQDSLTVDINLSLLGKLNTTNLDSLTRLKMNRTGARPRQSPTPYV